MSMINPLLSFKQESMPMSRLRPMKVNPSNFSGNSLSVSPSANANIELKIPALTCFVPSETNYQHNWITPTPSATTCQVVLNKTHPFSAMYVGSVNGIPLQDLSFADFYTHSVAPLELPQDVFLRNVLQDGLYPHLGLKNSNVSTYSKDGLTSGTQTAGQVDYFEPSQVQIGNIGTPMSIYHTYNLAQLFPNTFWCINQPVIFPIDILVRFTLTNFNQVGFQTSIPDNIPNATNTSWTASLTINNIWMNIYLETNLLIRDRLVAQLEHGYKLSIPYVQANKYSVGTIAQSASFQVNITKSYGRYLKKVYVCPYNASQTTLPVLKSNNNLNGTKISSIMTRLDGRQLLDSPLYCWNPQSSLNPNSWVPSSGVDPLMDKQHLWYKLRGCALPNYNSFQNAWAYLELFGVPTIEQGNKYPAIPPFWRVEDGLSLLGSNDRTLQVDITTPMNALSTSDTYTNSMVVYIFCVYVKTINVLSSGIVLEP